MKGEKKEVKESEVKTKVFNDMKNEKIFGSRITKVAIGGGKVSNKIKRFISNLLDIPVRESYGSTELSSGIASNGVVSKTKEVKIIDVPSLGYLTTNKPYGQGEICVKNDGKILRYFKEKELKISKIDQDDWYHTGDIGEMRGEYLIVIDRIGNVIKLAQGKFVSLEKIENEILSGSKVVQQIVMFPERNNKELYAICVVSEGVNKERVFTSIRSVGVKRKLANYKLPQKIVLTNRNFSIENNQLTISGKKCRKKILEAYKKEIDGFYSSSNEDILSLIMNVNEKDYDGKIVKNMGTDSLSAITLLNKVKEATGNYNFSYSQLMQTKICELRKILSETGNRITKKRRKKIEVSYKNEEGKFLKFLETIRKGNEGSSIKNPEKTGIFLTGCTGFVGKSILRNIQKEYPQSNIFVLSRKESVNKIESRSDNLTIIEGDLGVKYFGLSPEEFSILKNKVSFVIHVGAYVNHFLDYDELFKINVSSIYQILRLVDGVKPIHYISTISVLNQMNFKRKLKMKVNDQIHFHHNGYSTTKYVVDSLLYLHYKQSVIHRLSLIGPNTSKDSVKTNYNKSDWLFRLIKVMIDSKSVPSLNESDDVGINIYPLDFVAAFIVEISKNFSKKKVPRSFNYSNENISYRTICKFIIEWGKENGIEIAEYEFPEWIQKIKIFCSSQKETHEFAPFVEKFQRSKKLGSSEWIEFDRKKIIRKHAKELVKRFPLIYEYVHFKEIFNSMKK